MQTYSLVYTSESLLNLHDPQQLQELGDILHTARQTNPAYHITGALLFSEDRFVQCLEGPQTHVQALMKRITRDRRHRNVEIMTAHFVSRRRFTNWPMAFAGNSLQLRLQIMALHLHTLEQLSGDPLLDFMHEIISGHAMVC